MRRTVAPKPWARAACAATCLAALSTVCAAGVAPAERLRFVVSASEVEGGASTLHYEAAIDGPAGTDFDVLLKGSRFRMTARFLTDLVAPEELRVRATLETRRFHGTSERGLPLWEEDSRRHDLQLRLDEDLVLLPFGGPGEEPRLEVRIRPEALDHDASGKLDIDIRRRSADGSVSVQARWRPHRYRARAVLLAGGVPVARGEADCWLQEPTHVRLGPIGEGTAAALLLLDVTGFHRSRPEDLVEIAFDVTAADGRALAREWAGIGAAGAPMEYDLPGLYGPGSEERHVLRIEVEPIDPPAWD